MNAATQRNASATLPFRKVHLAGNDFILTAVPAADRDWPEEARRLCSRRTRIGADGLVVSTRYVAC